MEEKVTVKMLDDVEYCSLSYKKGELLATSKYWFEAQTFLEGSDGILRVIPLPGSVVRYTATVGIPISIPFSKYPDVFEFPVRHLLDDEIDQYNLIATV